MTTTKAYGATGPKRPLEPLQISRRTPGPHDVQVDGAYCGICHSDLHTVRGEWGGPQFPCVPGHEIVGRVSAVGSAVARFAVGDVVGVGCMVGSCGRCASCQAGLESYCDDGFWGTYDYAPFPDAPGHTLGGYSARIVVREDFVLRVTHPAAHLAAVAPLLCAGITTYSPLKHWGAGPGRKVGVVGIGGLGHMGVKLAHALGAETVGFTTSEHKRAEIRRLGADAVVVTSHRSELHQHKNSFDLIINTVSVSHNLDPYLRLLRRDGTLALVGAPEKPHPNPTWGYLVNGRRSIAGSLIGGIKETQEMLDFTAARGIVSDIELIAPSYIDLAYERMLKSDVKYRFVMDLSQL